MKLQLQLQFYLKTYKETNTEKSDYTLADDELWTNQVFFISNKFTVKYSLILCKCGKISVQC